MSKLSICAQIAGCYKGDVCQMKHEYSRLNRSDECDSGAAGDCGSPAMTSPSCDCLRFDLTLGPIARASGCEGFERCNAGVMIGMCCV